MLVMQFSGLSQRIADWVNPEKWQGSCTTHTISFGRRMPATRHMLRIGLVAGILLAIHQYPILCCGVHVSIVTIYIMVKAACFKQLILYLIVL